MIAFLPSSQGFLGLPRSAAVALKKARVVIIPFGLEKTVSFGRGTKRGPRAILEASPQLEFYDEEFGKEPWRDYGIATLKEPPIKKTMAAALDQIDGLVENVLSLGKFPFVLGGEHALTAGAIRPFARRYPKIGVLHFDAHADLRDGFEGERFSHAAALRRVLDHQEVVRLVSIGIRNCSEEESRFLRVSGKRVNIFRARDKASWKIADMLKPLKGLPVYLTFDVDAFDSSLMPATGTPEPGGLFWDETLDVIRAAARELKIVGADVVELAPEKGFHACDFLAAKLVYTIANFIHG
jgi:agmatinase